MNSNQDTQVIERALNQWHWSALQVRQLANWPDRLQNLFMGGLLVLMQLLGGWWLIAPLNNQWVQLETQQQQLHHQLTTTQRQLIAEAALREQEIRLNQEFNQLDDHFVKQEVLAALLIQINQLAQKNQLVVHQLQWGNASSPLTMEMKKHPLLIQMTGTYADLGQFSIDIANLDELILFEKPLWQRAPSQAGLVRFTATGSVFLLTGQEVTRE